MKTFLIPASYFHGIIVPNLLGTFQRYNIAELLLKRISNLYFEMYLVPLGTLGR